MTSPSVGLALGLVGMFSAASKAADRGAGVRLGMGRVLGAAAGEGQGHSRGVGFCQSGCAAPRRSRPLSSPLSGTAPPGFPGVPPRALQALGRTDVRPKAEVKV